MTTALDIRQRSAHLRKARPQLAADTVPQAFAAEQYQVLAYSLEQLRRAGRTAIAITSPVAGDGKTITSINLARTLARSCESPILLVDADLRRGSVGDQLGLGRATSVGLAGAIADPSCRLDGAVRRRSRSHLAVLPAGDCPPRPYDALSSPRCGELLAEARRDYAYVLVDTPPVVPVADLRALSQWVDGILLVVGAHLTPRLLVEEALSALDPEKVVGLVYNGDDQPLSLRYRSYYSYGDDAPKPGFWASLLGSGSRR